MNEIKSYYKMMPDYETYTPSNILLNTDIIFEDNTKNQLNEVYEDILRKVYAKLYNQPEPPNNEQRMPADTPIKTKRKITLKDISKINENDIKEPVPVPFDTDDEEYILVTNIINTLREKSDGYNVRPETAYFLKNRSIFVKYINTVFLKYKKDMALIDKPLTCDTISTTNKFSLLLHQKLISDYINIHTP